MEFLVVPSDAPLGLESAGLIRGLAPPATIRGPSGTEQSTTIRRAFGPNSQGRLV